MTIHTYIKDISELVLIDDLVNIVNRYSFHSTYNLLIVNCKGGHLDVVQYLVEYGADITANDNYALRWAAAENGHLGVVKYLVEHGAANNRAVRWAAQNGHLNVVKYLYEHGAASY